MRDLPRKRKKKLSVYQNFMAAFYCDSEKNQTKQKIYKNKLREKSEKLLFGNLPTFQSI